MRARASVLWLFAAAVLLVLCIDFERAFSNTQIFVFQTRDLARASLVAAGQPIFFGPEVTGGGNLPGGFYYYLLAIPLFFGGDWLAAWWLMAGLSVLAGLAGYLYLRVRVSHLCGLIFVGLFGTATLTRVFLRIFLNVSYLSFVAMLALVLACESCVAERAESRRRAFLGACFLLGLGVQLHLSVISWLFALLFLHLWALRKDERGVGLVTAIGGLGAFLAPLVPFFGWSALSAAGIQFGQPVFEGGSSREVAATYLHFLHGLRGFSLREIAGQLPKLFEAVPVGLLLLLLLRLKVQEPRRAIFRPLLACAAFGFVPFSYYFVAPIGFRYGMPLYLPLLMIFAILLDSARGHERKLRAYSAVMGALLILASIYVTFDTEGTGPVPIFGGVLLLAAMLLLPALAARAAGLDWRAHKWFLTALALTIGFYGHQRALKGAGFFNLVHIPNQIMPTVSQWRGLWRRVHGLTGWSFEEASKRIFFVNHHLEQDGAPAYRAAELGAMVPDEEVPYLEGRPHGFFVTLEPIGKVDPREWLLTSNIQADIKRALRDGSLQVSKPQVSSGLHLIAYWVREETHVPRGFHNRGAGYLVRGPGSPEPGAAVFRWNHCDGSRPYCDNAATVLVSQAGPGKWRIKVKVEGAPLSQSSPWINPDWTENLLWPYVEYSCGGKPERHTLADSIGYNRRYGVRRRNFPFNYNNSILAPFVRELEVSCGSRPTALFFGAEGGEADSVRAVTRLPPMRLGEKP